VKCWYCLVLFNSVRGVDGAFTYSSTISLLSILANLFSALNMQCILILG